MRHDPLHGLLKLMSSVPKPWCFADIGSSHCKDPYQSISTMECHGAVNVAEWSVLKLSVSSVQDMHLAFRKRGDFSNAIKAATLGLRHAAGKMCLVGPRAAYQTEKMRKKTFAMFFGHSHSFHAKLMADSHLSLKKLIELDKLNSLR